MIYYAFLIALILLFALGRQEDRRVWLVLVLVTIAEAFAGLVIYATGIVDNPDNILIRCLIEVATIGSLRLCCKGKMAFRQAVLITVALISHIMLYCELRFQSYLIYSFYEVILLVIGILQLINGHESIASIYRKAIRNISSLFRSRAVAALVLFCRHCMDNVGLVKRTTATVCEETTTGEKEQRQ